MTLLASRETGTGGSPLTWLNSRSKPMQVTVAIAGLLVLYAAAVMTGLVILDLIAGPS